MERKYSVATNRIGDSLYTLSCSSWVVVDGQREDVQTFNGSGYDTPELAWAAFIQWKGE